MATGEMIETPARELIPEERQALALAKLPAGLAVLKMENDNLMAMATAHPRSDAAIIRRIDGYLTAYPAMADTVMYNKPVGQVIDVVCKCGKHYQCASTKVTNCTSCGLVQPAEHSRPYMKFARGLSIRAAETLKEVWGCSSIAVELQVLDDGNVLLDCTWLDYQTGNRWKEPRVVSKFYKSRGGGMVAIDDGRFFATTVGAEKSKLIREVINRNLPAGLKRHFEDAAERIIDGRMTDSMEEKIVGFFSGKGISVEQLERVLGRTRKEGWRLEDRKTIGGLWQAIDQGEITLAEAFPAEEIEKKTNPSGQVTGSDLANAKKSEVQPTPKDSGKPSDAAVDKTKSDVDQNLNAEPEKEKVKEEIRKAVEQSAPAGKPPFPAEIGPLADIDDEMESCTTAIAIGDVARRGRERCNQEQAAWVNKAAEFYRAKIKAAKK